MADEAQRAAVRQLTAAADRFDVLAEVAELMGDDDGAARLQAQASARRMQAMALLDD